jgi:hypothetical protein
MMIDIGRGESLSAALIESAIIDQRFYINGSATYLVIITTSGRRISIEHGWGVDVYKIKQRIDASC